MQIVIYILLGLVAGVITAYFLLRRKEPKKDDTGLNLILQQINELSRSVDTKLSEAHKQVHQSSREQFDRTTRIVSDLTERLTRLDETNKQVVSFADQLQNLQEILKNPKQRGILGEYYLETLLKNVLPPDSYKMQYTFPDGTIVDAVVFVKDKIIPIDSKFSLENYNRLAEEKNQTERERLEKLFVNDLKNRIAETSKYIQPEQGTMEFAFMFIPHEAIYYDLIVNKIGALTEETENLIQRAASRYHVIIVSPTSFFAYLQTVLQGLKALQIEESAKEIRKRVEELGRHLSSYETYMQKLGDHLGTSVNTYNKAYKELKKIDKDVLRISGEAIGIEPVVLQAPQDEDGEEILG